MSKRYGENKDEIIKDTKEHNCHLHCLPSSSLSHWAVGEKGNPKKEKEIMTNLASLYSSINIEVASAFDLDSQHSSILSTGVASLSVLLYDWLFLLVCIHLMLLWLKWISSLMKMLLCKVLLKRERHIYHTTPKKITLSSNRHCLLTGIGQKIVGSLF